MGQLHAFFVVGLYGDTANNTAGPWRVNPQERERQEVDAHAEYNSTPTHPPIASRSH